MLKKAKCPYCSKELDQAPTSSKKCPHCKNKIIVRTSPDKEKVLLREDQVEEKVKEWKEVYRIRTLKRESENYKGSDFKSDKHLYNAVMYRIKNDFDSTWGEYNKALKSYLEEDSKSGLGERQLGPYRNIVLKMAQFLQEINKLKEALFYFIYVMYLDFSIDLERAEVSKKLDIISKKEYEDDIKYAYANNPIPFIAEKIFGLTNELNISIEDLRKEYDEVILKLREPMKLAKDIEALWNNLLKHK